ncbi:hypothetical protein RRG08_014555 [Elysia crispata]|uniref:Uncharacterized protein n=1 Tax=Elysia crispata TaxID=231223 RepID=A0AAE1AST0_9GAST|nr:hypothetical protein RRG08_014555 [Elysia crispata]
MSRDAGCRLRLADLCPHGRVYRIGEDLVSSATGKSRAQHTVSGQASVQELDMRTAPLATNRIFEEGIRVRFERILLVPLQARAVANTPSLGRLYFRS